MLHKPQTISIGIPAHNEQNAIKKLLESLLAQEGDNFVLEEILVISDGSTDKTVEEAKDIKDKRIRIFDDHKRLGKSARLNEIFQLFKGDILILCDADISIIDKQFISKVLDRVDISKAGICVTNFGLVPPVNFLENCLHLSIVLQTEIRKLWNNGNNYLSFRGAFLMLDRKLAKTVHMPDNLINNDAYIYFKAVEFGYHPKYLSDFKVKYKTPSTFKDHLAQSSRFQSQKDELSKYLKIKPADYRIPKLPMMKVCLKYFFKDPVHFIGYAGVYLATKILKDKNVRHTWTIATTTKNVF